METEPEAYECCVCFEDDRQFKLFPCQHYACSICVVQMADANGIGVRFPCPECRRPVNIPVPDYRRANEIVDIRRRNGQLRPQSRQQPVSTIVVPPAPPVSTIGVAGQVSATSINETSSVSEDDTAGAEAAEFYVEMINQESRCDPDCHPACVVCKTACLTNMYQSFCHPGQSCINPEETPRTKILKRILFLPFWIFCALKTVKPCLEIFNNDPKLQRDSLKSAGYIRRQAYNVIKQKTLPSFLTNRWFLSIGSIVLAAVLFINTICVSIGITSNAHTTLSIVGCTVNASLMFVWIFVSIYHVIKRETQKTISSLLFQLFASELTIYPQICISGIALRPWESTLTFPFCISLITLVIIWILRVVTIVKCKEFFSNVFIKLLIVMVGDMILVSTLIVILAERSDQYGESASTRFMIVICILISFSPLVCTISFYVGYLYEITQQAALILLRSATINVSTRLSAERLLDDLNSLHSFHKNLYPMVFILSGTLAYFWSFFMIVILAFSYDSPSSIMATVYCTVNVIVNHKIFLVSLSAYTTLLLLVVYVCLICSLAFGTMMMWAVVAPVTSVIYFILKR